MTTITTIEDLLQVLDEHPQWLEALRARLLTRELLALPERFAAFVDTTNQRFEQVDQRFEQIDQRFEQIDQRFEQIDQRFEQVDQRFEQIDQRFEQIDQRFEQVDQRFDRVEQRLDTLETDVKSLRDDMGILKGAHARTVAVEDAATIARSLGLRRTRTLSRDDLWDLTEAADTTDILPNELRSFRQADLIMTATDPAGEPCYLAVEISFTANGRDTTRAKRNAEFLTRFTGKPAHAVIAGLRQDDRIQPEIEAGEVIWHQLDPSDLEAD